MINTLEANQTLIILISSIVLRVIYLLMNLIIIKLIRTIDYNYPSYVFGVIGLTNFNPRNCCIERFFK